MRNTSSSSEPPRAPRQLWLFRTLAAVGIPVVLFLFFEAGLRVAGFGHPSGFLIPDERPGYFRTNPDFGSLFMPESFNRQALNFRVAARKPANTVRIVVLGESVAQGIPVPAFAFAPQLRAQLRARYPGKEIEVLNTGIVAINSHVVYQIARSLAQFSPDLFVVYLGNNEVVGPYGPGCAYRSEMPPLWVIRLSVFVRSTRTGQLMTAGLNKLGRAGQRPLEWGGMAMFANNAVRADDPRLEAVYRNFAANLRDIVRVATGAGAKTLLCTVAGNLKDCAPFLSLHRPGCSGAELASWQRAFDRGKLEWLLDEADAARVDLQEAYRLDPQYADTAFMLGKLELQAGDLGAARRHLVEAEHWDALRFRPDPRINEVIRRVAQSGPASVRLLDSAMLLGADPASSGPPAGRELLFEHVHFDWEGNYQLAALMAQAAEKTLFPGSQDRPAWLDSAGCAAALAYTNTHERLPMLQRVEELVQRAPFTNQLTYREDQARLARAVDRARAYFQAPELVKRAREVANAAMAADPDNPTLVGIARAIATDLGDYAGALRLMRRERQLQPEDFPLVAAEVWLLARLDRHDEAVSLLRNAVGLAGTLDTSPVFADLFIQTKHFAEGRMYFNEALVHRPSDSKLRLIRGRLARLAGDTTAALQEFRAILAADPANEGALEELIGLLTGLGQSAAAEEESIRAADQQPRNHANDLRAAKFCERRDDDRRAARFLAAAENCGPVTAAMEMGLAQHLYRLQQQPQALEHLAVAKRLSILEGNAEMTESISEFIAQWRAEGT